MSKFVNISTTAPRQPDFSSLPKSFSVYEREIKAHLKTLVDEVLTETPDLIVFPECSNRYVPNTRDEMREFYTYIGEGVVDYLKGLAKENNTNIAYCAHRLVGLPKEAPFRNSTTYIGRNGEILGVYDKNYVMSSLEYDTGVAYGDKAELIELDFGKVATAICFDLNFDELLDKYAKQKPDIVVFSSAYHGGEMRQAHWAYKCRSFFVGSIIDKPSAILNPYGEIIASTTNYTRTASAKINLDYALCHMDYNMEKITLAKQKYGNRLSVYDPGYFGSVMLSYLDNDKTVEDVMTEFGINTLDAYLDGARLHRSSHI